MGWAEKLADKSGFARFIDTVTGDVIGVNEDGKSKRRKTSTKSGTSREDVNDLRKRIGSLEAKLERRDATIEKLKERVEKMRTKKKVVVRRG